MKKILILLSMMILSLCLTKNVYAKKFEEGDYINGDYIKKINGNKTEYLTMQFIVDKDNPQNIVYCLEPFAKFSNIADYLENDKGLGDYDLTEEQKRKIELLMYYGYGYPGHEEPKWYSITQYLIWKTVEPKAQIYYTKTLNGNKVTKYSAEIQELENDIANHQEALDVELPINVSYGADTSISFDNNKFEIVSSDFDYEVQDGTLKVKKVVDDGFILYRRKNNRFDKVVQVYTNKDSQDLMIAGNPDERIFKLYLIALKGNITLNIKKDDDSVYTSESDFTNTCYGVYDINDTLLDKVCTNEEMVYKTKDMPFGKYYVKQLSHGLGYKEDPKKYDIEITNYVPEPSITLNNLLIKNKIEIVKYACKNGGCSLEDGASFTIKDKLGKEVRKIKTDNKGEAFVTLGYGTYTITQVRGLEGYSLVDSYTEKIVDEENLHQKNLYNYFIEKEEPPKEPESPEEPKEPEIPEEPESPKEPEELSELPPDTGLKFSLLSAIEEIFRKIQKVLCIFLQKC